MNGDGRPDLFALTADGKTIWALDQQTGATLYGVAPVAPVSSITTGTARGGGYLVVSAPSTMDVTFLSEQALPQL